MLPATTNSGRHHSKAMATPPVQVMLPACPETFIPFLEPCPPLILSRSARPGDIPCMCSRLPPQMGRIDLRATAPMLLVDWMAVVLGGGSRAHVSAKKGKRRLLSPAPSVCLAGISFDLVYSPQFIRLPASSFPARSNGGREKGVSFFSSFFPFPAHSPSFTGTK